MRKRSTVIQSLEDNWQEMKDPKSGKTFYYNTITGVSAWEIPSVSTSKSASQDDKKDKANKAGKDENTQQETEKAVEPGAENIKSEKKKKKKKKSKSKKTPAKKWKVKTDDKGRTYYVNTETRKSQWTVPEELKSNVSGSEVVVGENATDKEGGVENVKSDVLKVASYSYDKSLVLKRGTFTAANIKWNLED